MTATTEGVEDFFGNVSSGPLPSAKLSQIGDMVYGEIVDQFKVDKKKFASDEVEKDQKTGEPIKQLVVVLQTEQRNWEGVSKVPYVDPSDKSKGHLPPEADEGRRAVYVAPWTNLHAAVGKAIVEGTGQRGGLKKGAKFGVKVIDLEDTGKGNPKKVHQAHYEAPAAGGDFFGSNNTAGGPGDASVAQPAPQQSAPQAALDPWGVNPQQGSKPPF